MDEIENYQDSSAHTSDDIESSEGESDNLDEENSKDAHTSDEDGNLLSLSICARDISSKSFEYTRLFLILKSLPRSPWILLCPFLVT
ncbi:hypothetical protein H5410_060358 [Solanum commersonii]|uniref:Uncharacterized protein n=1 Tax=Solanum commersonii TaxID=4109 RepID=A0A9J5W5T4_SOLCO|nr:hypothetical protein H5410_060358 [Solanum commersonii]